MSPIASGSSKGPLPKPRGQQPGFQDLLDKQGQGRGRRKKNGVNLDAQQVKELHRASDKDSDTDSHHHSLGSGPTQAAPGNHSHRMIGIWLYKDTAGTHNSTGNYILTSWQAFKFWDKEYYKKIDSNTVQALKEHVVDITAQVSFDANNTGNRGIHWNTTGGTTQQTMEVVPLTGRVTRVFLYATGITLSAGENVTIESFQSSGANLGINAGLHISFLKIIRRFPQKIDLAGLSTTIVPQTPGPEIASRQFFLNGVW